MIKINLSPKAPDIVHEIKKIIKELEHPEDYCLTLQLDYRDHNTIFYLNDVTAITFARDWLKIKQKNNSRALFNYTMILEYCVINAEEVMNQDLGVV